ncbi:MAG: acyl-ACP--UDP-N-acetylglucosamine O-acyltransferase [Candidatus Omnitrophota bacterium]
MIDKTAIIHKKAYLAFGVSVGPYTVIGENVKIGPNTQIANSCTISGNTTIGANCKIFSCASIGSIPQDLKYNGEDTKLVIGDNNIFREFVTVNLGTIDKGTTSIGNSNLFMAYSHVAHDCVIGSHCIIANVGTLAGHVEIEDRAVIGGLVAIHQFTRVGTMSIIGGCSKVVQDVPPYSVCDGHPTKVFNVNLVGLRRAGIKNEIIADLKKAFKILFFEGLNLSHAIEQVQSELPFHTEIKNLIEFVRNSKRGICK